MNIKPNSRYADLTSKERAKRNVCDITQNVGRGIAMSAVNTFLAPKNLFRKMRGEDSEIHWISMRSNHKVRKDRRAELGDGEAIPFAMTSGNAGLLSSHMHAKTKHSIDLKRESGSTCDILERSIPRDSFSANNVTLPPVSGQIWHDMPVFKIRFKTIDALNNFRAALDSTGVDFENGVRIDSHNLLVDIHYLPRLARKLIPSEAIALLTPDNIEDVDGGIGYENLNQRDPYRPLFARMTTTFNEKQEFGFEMRAAAWEDKCRQANARELRPLCDTKFEASNADVSNLFKHITEQDQDLILGENHEDDHSFLEKNIAYFADRGYDTLLLEGVHYETQSMLDAWFKSSESTPPLELKLLLGSKLSLVTKAKAARIRVVGIDSEQTYIVNTPDMRKYAKTRENAMNDMACEIYEREKAKGAGKCLFYVGSSHALESPSGTLGIATFVPAPVVILRNARGMSEESNRSFRILSGSEKLFRDKNVFTEFVEQGEVYTTVEFPMKGGLNPACDVWLEASPGADWSLK